VGATPVKGVVPKGFFLPEGKISPLAREKLTQICEKRPLVNRDKGL